MANEFRNFLFSKGYAVRAQAPESAAQDVFKSLNKLTAT